MDNQAVLQKVRSQMELSEATFAVAEKLSDKALNLIEGEGIVFEEYSQIGFLSHLFNMTARMEHSEHLPAIDADVMEQLEEEPLRVADGVADLWSKQFGERTDDAERALIAIHLQTAISKQNKNKN
ncbi:MAG: PRD domain-containing protein [Angelakisella sp.]